MESLEQRMLLSGDLPAPASPTNPQTVDLLAVYTPAAEAAAGGAEQMLVRIQADVADANLAYANSQVYVNLHLVRTAEVNYTENNDLTVDLQNLHDGTGALSTVASLRDSSGADLVAMYIDPASPNVGGLSYTMTDPTRSDNADWAQSVIVMPPLGPKYGLAHELGHLMGAGHSDPTSSGAFPYSHGYRFTADGTVYRDVMTYAPGTIIPYFSNPDVLYHGVATGSADANNALTLNQTSPVVSQYRAADVSTPSASLLNSTINAGPVPTITFTVQYSANVSINRASLANAAVTVIGPGGFSEPATFVSVPSAYNNTPLVVTYSAAAPADLLTSPSGTYSVQLASAQVMDVNGLAVPGGNLGSITLPNLAPYQPTGWSSNLVLTTTPGTFIDAANFWAEQNVYLDWAFNNVTPFTSFTLPQNASVRNIISLDGTAAYENDANPADLASGYFYATDINLGKLTPGTHTVSIAIDAPNDVPESSKTDNTITRTFTVLGLSVSRLDTGQQVLNQQTTPISLGSTTVGGDQPTVTFVVHNDFSAAITIANLVLPVGFSVVEPLAGTIAPGSSDTLVIRLDNTAAGTKSGQISFDDSDPSTPVFAFPVTASVGPAQSNLSVQQPSGTASPLLTSTSPTATADSPTIYDNQNVFVDFTQTVSGAPLQANSTTTLSLDGATVRSWNIAAVQINSNPIHLQASLGRLKSGQHTIKVQLDAGNAIAESDKADNVITKTITVISRRDSVAPTAVLSATASRVLGSRYKLTITYSDNRAVAFRSISSGNVLITGPKRFRAKATLVKVNRRRDGSPITVTYAISAPGGRWDASDSGVYTVKLLPRQVRDTSGNYAPAQTLGTFAVNIPAATKPQKPHGSGKKA